MRHYAERHYAECRFLFVVMLSVIMLSVIMLSVIMLSVIMLSVVMLSVVAPHKKLFFCWSFQNLKGSFKLAHVINLFSCTINDLAS